MWWNFKDWIMIWDIAAFFCQYGTYLSFGCFFKIILMVLHGKVNETLDDDDNDDDDSSSK